MSGPSKNIWTEKQVEDALLDSMESCSCQPSCKILGDLVRKYRARESEDTARLDWIQAHDAKITLDPTKEGFVVMPWSGGLFRAKTVRKAVDIARKAVP